MSTITDKLIYLQETKNAIRNAIEDKGVIITDEIPFRQYADSIRDIIEPAVGANAIYSKTIVTVNEAGEIPIWPYENLVDPTYGYGLSDKIYFALAYFTNPEIILCCLPLGKKDLSQWFTSSYSIEMSVSGIRYTSPTIDAAAYWTVDKNVASGLTGKSCSLYICKK